MPSFEKTHDPKEYIEQLQQLLISDKKRIAFLFGAGTSFAKKGDLPNIPDIKGMTKQVEDYLSTKEKKYQKAICEIKKELGNKYNIETFLSHIEQKKTVIGEGTLNGLSRQKFDELIEETKKKIVEISSIHEKIEKSNTVSNLIHSDFAQWIGRANRKYPIEIFTTNYDYLFEMGLEHHNIPYYDGFTGSYNPFFDSDAVSNLKFLPNQTKLWKLHGSLGWIFKEHTKKILRGKSTDNNRLIYPSSLKYNDSKKLPYTAFMDRLTNFLRQSDTLLIICGYSFTDEHINEIILSGLRTEKSGNAIALCYDISFKDGKKQYSFNEKDSPSLFNLSKQNNKISVYACQSAVIGCQYGKWKLKSEPDREQIININLYFDEDAPKEVRKKSQLEWMGEGELILPDFLKFIAFLQSMIISPHLNLEQNGNE